jgi:thiamine pyrophosphokinase
MKKNDLNALPTHTPWQIIGPLFESYSLNQDYPTVLIDGGVDKFNGKHHFSIGDGDSLKSDHDFDVKLDPEKDFSDLKAFLNLIETAPKKLLFHGFLGGRLDHECSNLGELWNFLLNQKCSIELYQNAKLKVMMFHKGHHQIQFQGGFSLYSLEKCYFQIEGNVKYPLAESLILPFSSHTLSNKSFGDFSIKASTPFWIYLND